MAYASGKYSWGECDRCGWHYPLRELRREWTELLVCKVCWDYEPEQITPIIYQADAEALRNPRPQRDRIVSDGTAYTNEDPIGRVFKGQSSTAQTGVVQVIV